MLKTAIVWFIISGAPHHGVYNFGTLGPFPTQERCKSHQAHLSKYLDKGSIGNPFRDRTTCLPVEIVIGAAAKEGAQQP